MSSTLREIWDIFTSSALQPRFWAVFGAVLMMFTFIGPFGTLERLEFPMRFAYWATMMIGCWLIAMFFISVILGLCPPRFRQNIFPVLIAAAISAVPGAWFIASTIGFFLEPEVPVEFGLRLLSFNLPISLSFSVIVSLVLRHDEDAVSDANPADNALVKRLQPGNRGPVKYMSMQDHYISVTTTRGTELILMRMADAVAMLDPYDGLQVHRSHWVGKNYVERGARKGGQPILTMDDGTEIPVSRSYTKAVKDAVLI